MTVSSTRGTKITIDAMVLAAYKLAGLLDASATTGDAGVVDQLGYGRVLLDIILDQLSVVPDARNVDWEDVTCVADQQTYTLAEEIVDVIDDGVYVAAGQTAGSEDSNTVVTQIDREGWNRLTSKGDSGTPTLMYVHRGNEDSYQIVLYLWLRPEEAGTVRLQVQRAPADTTTGSDTIDLKSAWNAYVLHELASQLCFSANGSSQRGQTLMIKAAQLKREARNFAALHSPVPFDIRLQPAQRRGR